MAPHSTKTARYQPISAARRKRQVWGIVRSVVFLAIMIALALWISRSSGNIRVLSVTPATTLDSSFRPVKATDTYGPNDTFFVAVQLEGYHEGVPLRARWRYNGRVINETALSTAETGDGYAGFSPSRTQPWAVGAYSVEIVSNDTILGAATFHVEDQP